MPGSASSTINSKSDCWSRGAEFDLSPVCSHTFVEIDHEIYWTKVKTLHLNCLPSKNQECKWMCILMFKYWVMHNSKSYTDVVTRKHMEAFYMWHGSNFFRLQIWTEISHCLGLQISTTYEIRLHKMVVYTCDNQKCEGLISSVFWLFRKAILKSRFSIKRPRTVLMKDCPLKWPEKSFKENDIFLWKR